MSALVLKIILIVTMTLDHTAIVFLERGSGLYTLFRIFGRPALPIACFLIAEGFAKTSSRAKYTLRVFFTALVAELFWFYLWTMQRLEALKNAKEAYEAAGGDAVFGAEDGLNKWFEKLPAAEQTELTGWVIPGLNILFTFVICMLMLIVVQKIRDHFGDLMVKQFLHNLGYMACMGATIMVTILVCMLFPLSLDYSVEAPIIILICYMFREERKTMAIMLGVMALFMATQSIYFAMATLLGIVCVFAYNGELGYDKTKHPMVRILFYAYYPVHLAVLVESRYFHEIYSNFFGKG
ncbi:MAG: hypothetical protein J5649_06675 [Lachnospiraceae bacterium]|nr:hypothetical protein [Lachnospiraceae bacterium]